MKFNNFTMFDKLSSCMAFNNLITLPQSLNIEMLQYLNALEHEFKRYLFKLNEYKLDLVQYVFRLPAEKVPTE